jgi:hypothetical protein
MITMVQVEVPSTDSRRYEHVTLARNGLRCLLVEDVKAEKSAAAVAVRVGQMQDGPLPGLAHLTGTGEYGDCAPTATIQRRDPLYCCFANSLSSLQSTCCSWARASSPTRTGTTNTCRPRGDTR